MKNSNPIFGTVGIFFIFSIINASSVHAQIITDRAQIIPDGTTPTSVTCVNSCQITGGTQAGINLFHSFSEFNINSDQQVFFRDPGVTNIFNRVTGSNSSLILGRLGVRGNANLFLINPNGITFGANSSLNINGSFAATTANAIEFKNGGFFRATNPNEPALLTVAPSAFLFNQLPPRAIAIQSASLKVGDNQNLLLLGGDVAINDGSLQAPGGNIEIAGVKGLTIVELSNQNNNLSLTFPTSVIKANVSISNSSTFNVNASDGGNITVNAQNIDISESDFQTKNTGNINFNNRAGNIKLIATGNLQIKDSNITNNDSLKPIGKPGSVLIKASSLLLDSVNIQTNNADKESIGGVFVQVDNDAIIQNDSELLTRTNGRGNASEINIKSGSLLIDNSVLFADTFGAGDAGNISIQTDNLVLNNGSRLSSNTEAFTGVGGNGGEIVIDAKTVSLANGSAVYATSSEVGGQAGDVVINAEDSISLINSAIFSETSSQGDGGNTQINTNVLNLSEGAIISSRSEGSGTAGDIEITATDLVSISGINPDSLASFIELLPDTTSSGLFATTEAGGTGKGGNISVSTNSLKVMDGAVISARSNSTASGGNINIDTNNLMLTGGGQILASAFNSGSAGNITVNAKDSTLIVGSIDDKSALFSQDNNGSNSGLFVGVESEQITNAGNINLATSSLRIYDRGTISAETNAGEGGNIDISSQDIRLRNDSQITASAGEQGNGGNIDINTDTLVALENSDITATAFEGRGGKINITTQGLFASADSEITASSRKGINGVVEINRPESDPNDDALSVPVEPVDLTELIATGCGASGSLAAKTSTSKFIITGRGGLPPTPTEVLKSDLALADLGTRQDVTARTITTKQIDFTPIPIVEAQGWVISPKGQVVLTASAPEVTPEVPWLKSPSCHNS
ncbi:MAG: filamentous hemagglutinin N-terminal domain-containing protein [Chroococcus sp. CMT-3BRIN-NPC107]|jgi:filamentous hemagglutinin family protein|nr:filamentous hemagglutinin N-terminal domain-containing protein [Chroococcus sp. CMT-3BRIN-NPC107]